MRSIFLFVVFVCAVGAASIGCGNGEETNGGGGTAGTGGTGGSGGTGGTGGSGGTGGTGGSGTGGTGGTAGGGGIAPVIEKVEWEWVQPCTFGTPGEVTVTITATDADTPEPQLTYSGDIGGGDAGCTSITDRVTTLECDDHPGLRGGPATVTDPQGNEDMLNFAFDPCVDGCEGDACL